MKEGRKPEYPEKTPGDELQMDFDFRTPDVHRLLLEDNCARGKSSIWSL